VVTGSLLRVPAFGPLKDRRSNGCFPRTEEGVEPYRGEEWFTSSHADRSRTPVPDGSDRSRPFGRTAPTLAVRGKERSAALRTAASSEKPPPCCQASISSRAPASSNPQRTKALSTGGAPALAPAREPPRSGGQRSPPCAGCYKTGRPRVSCTRRRSGSPHRSPCSAPAQDLGPGFRNRGGADVLTAELQRLLWVERGASASATVALPIVWSAARVGQGPAFVEKPVNLRSSEHDPALSVTSPVADFVGAHAIQMVSQCAHRLPRQSPAMLAREARGPCPG